MNDTITDTRIDTQDDVLELEYELNAPPDKVWRAISMPELRGMWFPSSDLAGPDPLSSITGKEISYRIRGNEAPFLDSEVKFLIRPNGKDGTTLTIIHTPSCNPDRKILLMAANDGIFATVRAAC